MSFLGELALLIPFRRRRGRVKNSGSFTTETAQQAAIRKKMKRMERDEVEAEELKLKKIRTQIQIQQEELLLNKLKHQNAEIQSSLYDYEHDEEDDYEEEGSDLESSADNLFLQLITKAMNPNTVSNGQGFATGTSSSPEQNPTSFSDDQIKELIASQLDKKYISLAKKMPDDQVAKYVVEFAARSNIILDQDTINRSVHIIKNEV